MRLPTESKRNTQGGRRRVRRPNLPALFYNILQRNWDAAFHRTITHPHEIYAVEDSSGDTPLHFACRLDPSVEIVKALLPLCCMEKNLEGATPLHVAASHRCSSEVIKVMIDKCYVDAYIQATTTATTNATSNTTSTTTSTANSNSTCNRRNQGQTHTPSPTLSLTNRGRTPVHYACISFRGLDIEAFRILFEATIEACVQLEKSTHDAENVDMNLDMEEWESDVLEENKNKLNAFTMQDHFGYSPLSLLFKRYRQRVRYVIRILENSGRTLSSSVAASCVQEELGNLWLKARLIVGLMAEKNRGGENPLNMDYSDEPCPVALEAARWATQRHQSKTNNDVDNEDEDDDVGFGGTQFRLVHASVALAGYGCPIEMIRLAMTVYPNQVREMDEDGNLPLHIAAVSNDWTCQQSSSSTTNSDEDSLISSLSTLSGMTSRSNTTTSKPFEKVIRMLLRSYPEATQIPHGRSGRLPLVLAIDARQRTMEDGIKILLEAYPAALETKDFDPKLYPYILSKIGKPRQIKKAKQQRFPWLGRKKEKQTVFPTALFDALRAKPQLLLNCEPNHS